MHRYGCIQAKVAGVELTLDPTRALPVPAGSLKEEAPKEVLVSGDEPPPARVNPLLRHPSLGLGPLLRTTSDVKAIAP